MGPVSRPLYGRERRAPRKKGVLHAQAPISCPDATDTEIAMALYALCEAADVRVGQGGEYDSLKDEYTIIGKSKLTGKAQDFKVAGLEVGALIQLLRSWNGVAQFDRHALTKAMA